MEAETIRNRTTRVDKITSTEELEEAKRQVERQMKIEKEQRDNMLTERAQQAELQVYSNICVQMSLLIFVYKMSLIPTP